MYILLRTKECKLVPEARFAGKLIHFLPKVICATPYGPTYWQRNKHVYLQYCSIYANGNPTREIAALSSVVTTPVDSNISRRANPTQ